MKIIAASTLVRRQVPTSEKEASTLWSWLSNYLLEAFSSTEATPKFFNFCWITRSMLKSAHTLQHKKLMMTIRRNRRILMSTAVPNKLNSLFQISPHVAKNLADWNPQVDPTVEIRRLLNLLDSALPDSPNLTMPPQKSWCCLNPFAKAICRENIKPPRE
ncbi:hypothetical protein WN943_021878 [Citrus x changshan-huyou]